MWWHDNLALALALELIPAAAVALYDTVPNTPASEPHTRVKFIIPVLLAALGYFYDTSDIYKTTRLK